jgi:energy-coupling factor transporter ATP-binding protein EcfA2
MSSPRYTASKTLPKGRSSYVINFRHPLRKDPKTGQGLKVRRGLGTTDAADADALVAEMNQLLSNESFHSISMKPEAARKFSNIIVNAFYDDLENVAGNNWDLRERYLPLPTAEEGYAKVLFVGTTGAGKTSLLRHLIGSDPDKDRFPSTSTAKTTIADTEIIMADAPYRAVVTFFSEASVLTNIRECLVEACLKTKAELDKALVGDGKAEADDSKIVNSLLNHPAQRFRLGYTLGLWNPRLSALDNSASEEAEEEDEWNDDDDSLDDADGLDSEATIPTLVEKAQIQATLESYVRRIRQMTVTALEVLTEALGGIDLEEEDPDIIEELFGDTVLQQEDFSDLTNDIMDEVQKRFDWLTGGSLRKRGSGWPEVWSYENEDRDEFIAKVRLLSSNYAKYFGRLLTPIVEGVRVSGPFAPVFANTDRKLIFMDGQGLGHTPDSATSVTTHITERFKDVDLILLVDSAKHPMQAAPLSVIRSVAASGYQKKLAIAFTHFDQVKGANLLGSTEKRAHVLASLVNGLKSLSDALGNKTVRSIERNLDERCFMIGGLNRSLEAVKKKPKNTSELERLLDFCQNAIKEDSLDVEAHPIYDPASLMFALQAATDNFRHRWDALLGLGKLDGVSKEHWTRIWALNRRLADRLEIEYSSLKPVADLLTLLTEGSNNFLSHPTGWTKKPKTEEEEDAAINSIKQTVNEKLFYLSKSRIADEPLKRWQDAFRHSGRGSTFKRAEDIQMLYSIAAPELGTVMTEVAREFLNEMRQIVYTAIDENGGKMDAGAEVINK